MKNILVMAIAMLLSNTSFAQFFKGNDLKRWADGYDRIEQGYPRNTDPEFLMGLYGYVIGVVDSDKSHLVCVLPGTTTRQVSAIVAKYLNKNPELWGMDANYLVISALAPVFPCRKE